MDIKKNSIKTLVIGLALVVLGVIFTSYLYYDFPYISHDTANNFFVAGKMSRGEILYKGVIDNNPPSIYLLMHYITNFGWSAKTNALVYYALVFVFFVLGVEFLMSRKNWQDSYFVNAAILVGYLYLFTGASLDVREFGQREHLFALAIYPLIAASLFQFQHEKRRHMVFLVIAGFLATMKPQFLLFVFLLELAAQASRHKFCVKSWILLLLGPALGLSLWALHSVESVSAGIRFLYDFHSQGGGDAYKEELSRFFWGAEDYRGREHGFTAILSMGIFGVCLWRGWRNKNMDRFRYVLLAVFIGLSIGFLLLQGKFYHYHFHALTPFVILSGVVCFTELRRSGAVASQLTRSFALGLSSLLIVSNLYSHYAHWWVNLSLRSGAEEMAVVVENVKKVYLLSTSALDHMNLYFHKNIELVNSFAYDMELPAVLAIEDENLRDQALRRHFRQVRREIEATNPDLIVFSARPDGIKDAGFLWNTGKYYRRYEGDQLRGYKQKYMIDGLVFYSFFYR